MASQELEQAVGVEPSADANQYLTFTLDDGDYGVDILAVQEIKGYVPTTRMPNSPPEVVGVLNLRGTIVPVVDLRRTFRLDQSEFNQFTVIVVVVVQGRTMGMIVDSVSEVTNIAAADIQDPASFSDHLDIVMIQGVAKVGEKLIILLDIEAVLLGTSSRVSRAA